MIRALHLISLMFLGFAAGGAWRGEPHPIATTLAAIAVFASYLMVVDLQWKLSQLAKTARGINAE
jgi:hypothetical protein